MMKKWTSALLASSLVFSTIGATTVTNDANAKESTKVETAAAAKKSLYQGFKGGESKAKVKKIAKKKGWKLKSEDKYTLIYSNVNFYGQKKGTTEFVFLNSDELNNIRNYNPLNYKGKPNKTTDKYLKNKQDKLISKVKKDIGNKKPGYSYYSGPENEVYGYTNAWYIKKITIRVSTALFIQYSQDIDIDFGIYN